MAGRNKNPISEFKQNTANTWVLRVALIYVIACAIYAVLAVFLREGPIVIIDESLYTNIARSLAWEGKIAYRGQPIDYPYILYPIILVPLYWLHSIVGGDIYRWVQIFNVLLICSSVFPVFLFASHFCKDQKKGFIAACFTAIMPDMMMAFFEMSEAVLWPLALWAVFFAWMTFQNSGSLKWPLLLGLFSGLMYATKPGAIAMGVGIILFMGINAAKEGRGQWKRVIFAVAGCAGLIVLMYLVDVFVFGYKFSVVGLYQKQTSDWSASHAVAAVEACILLVFAFCFALIGFFAMIPYYNMRKYDITQRNVILAATIGLALVLIGTAILVVPYKWNGNYGNIPIHMRYAAMYIPVWFVFCLPDEIEAVSKKMIPGLMVFCALAVFPGVRMGFVEGDSGIIDSLSLAAFDITKRLNGRITGLFMTIAMVLIVSISLTSVGSKQKKGYKSFFIGCFAFTLLFHGICGGYVSKVYIDSTIAEDARELNTIISKEDVVLGITQRFYDDIYSYWQEAHLNRPMQQVTFDQMFVEMESKGGVYKPFVPVEQAPNKNNGSTPDTSVFVLGQTVAEHLELNKEVQTKVTANGHYTVAYGVENQRLIDSMMYGLDDNRLYPGIKAQLLCFDERTGNMSLQMTVLATGPNANITISSGDISNTFTTKTNEPEMIQVEIPVGAVHISTDVEVQIVEYSTGD